MRPNFLANNTIQYIWSHPANKGSQLQAIVRFLRYQTYKHLTKKSLDVTFYQGIKLRCYSNSRSASAIVYCGLYDYDEMNFLLQFLQDGDSFLDVGANVGIYTLLAAHKTPTGQIFSIEALPQNMVRLEENLSLNQFANVITHQLAISDHQGKVTLDLADGDCTSSIASQAHCNGLQIATDTLDNLLWNQTKHLTLAKMDIEGAELLALRGAVSLLQQHRPIVWILEINSQIQNFDYTAKDLIDFLDSYDYGLYRYSAEHHQMAPMTLAEKTGNNVLAIARPFLDLVHQRLKSSDAW